MLKMGMGKRLGDCRYIDRKPTDLLAHQKVDLIAILKKKYETASIDGFDKYLLHKRSIIETINDQLKNVGDLEYSRHRSPTSYLSNIITSRMTYSYPDKNRLSI
jgi:hypothetical protein